MVTPTQLGRSNQIWPRLLYGAVFILVLPAALILWARAAAPVVHVPILHAPLVGATIAALGIAVILAGMQALWRRGGGLPMNAFPPPRFVAGGIYGLVPHPIYGGFVLACAGIAIAAGSAAGLWLVTPAVALGCAALVLGYELPDLDRRFGLRASSSAWMPSLHDGPPTGIECLRFYIVILLPWFVCFELISFLGPSPHALSTYMDFESRLPVRTWAEIPYWSIYTIVLLTPALIRTAAQLRLLAGRALASMALMFPLYLLLPFYVPPRPFHASGLLATLMQWERTPLAGSAAFPSYHVVWACLVAATLGGGPWHRKALWWMYAALVSLSCILTGMHSIADVVAGFAAFLVISNLQSIWRLILRSAEHLANSWREWRSGPIRIINHGAYAGAGAFAGMLVINALIGLGGAAISASICLCTLVCAALWAQWVEGSPALLRPLGFYGGVIGSILGALVALPLHVSLWTVLAAISVAAPWIQSLGRLRCLVQGCCHGAATSTTAGIRYTHPRTRVCRLAHLSDVPIHATQVYSILWNMLIAAALLRLVALHMPAAFLCGIYHLLSGTGRFVEEAYRGEPQTRILAGLRFYQWIAIVGVIFGAALTCVRTSATVQWHVPDTTTLALALASGLLTWMISGVDFPESTRRFARLT